MIILAAGWNKIITNTEPRKIRFKEDIISYSWSCDGRCNNFICVKVLSYLLIGDTVQQLNYRASQLLGTEFRVCIIRANGIYCLLTLPRLNIQYFFSLSCFSCNRLCDIYAHKRFLQRDEVVHRTLLGHEMPRVATHNIVFSFHWTLKRVLRFQMFFFFILLLAPQIIKSYSVSANM